MHAYDTKSAKPASYNGPDSAVMEPMRPILSQIDNLSSTLGYVESAYEALLSRLEPTLTEPHPSGPMPVGIGENKVANPGSSQIYSNLRDIELRLHTLRERLDLARSRVEI